MKKLVIATRGSKLALWQANHIKDLIEARWSGRVRVELLIVKTQGDKILDVPLAKVGGKGLFVKEIEEAMLEGRADLAVHSMKDVPAELPQGLELQIVPEREELSDLFLSVRWDGVEDLPQGAKVGTSSLRRQAQLLAMRPDLEIASLRGNVDTRLRKLMQGEFEAIIMASAGMRRLGLSAPKTQVLGPPDFLPAVGQGALGIEYATDRADLDELLGFLNHEQTRICVEAERGFLIGLDGGCQVPIAGCAVTDGKEVRLTGLVSDLTAERVVREELSGPVDKAGEVGAELARVVLGKGGKEILDELYGCDA